MESPTHEPDWNRSKKGSSRRKSANHPPIQRSGSKLEVLPPEDFKTSLYPTNSAVQTLVNSEASPRLIQSAGSDGRRSCTGELMSSTPPIQRSSSEGRLTPGHGDHTTRKQVVLPTVKRNFEKHGLPVDGIVSIHNVDQQNCRNHHHHHHPGSDKHSHPSHDDEEEMPEAMEMKAEELISKLKMTEEVGERLQPNSQSQTAVKSKNASGSNSIEDSYYISHTPSLQQSDETLPSSSNSEGSIVQTESSSASVREEERKDDKSSSSSDDSDEEEEKAPFELMGEFLEAVMDEDYETADKLCKMIMMYEPDNSECKQFQPLIEEMLKREREAQLWGSDDSDDDEDADYDSEDDDDDDDEEGEESDEDSESSSEESTEEGSSESEEENEDTAQEEGQR